MLAGFPARPQVMRAFTDVPTPTPPLEGPPARFPHVRAALNTLAKQHRPLETDDDEVDHGRVSNELLNQIVSVLDEEDDEGLQDTLKAVFGVPRVEVEQHALDLMHAHKSDIAGVPFLFIGTPRRPISRPSSRASTHSIRRAETPVSYSAPSSPLASLFRRPPLVSPSGLSHSQSSSYIASSNLHQYIDSPSSSPVLGHATLFREPSQYTSSLPPSPLQSPRLLNAKANEFRPGPSRPLSRASSYAGSLAALRAQTPSPDLWSTKASSNLAIAAPLLPEISFSRVNTPTSGLRSVLRPDDDDDDDPFDPFSAQPDQMQMPMSFPSIEHSEYPQYPDPNFEVSWSTLSNSNSTASMSPDDYVPQEYAGMPQPDDPGEDGEGQEPDSGAGLTDGMTPFDVLSSVFGTTLAPSELEEALAANAYDFDKAMAWLIERSLPSPPQKNAVANQYVGSRVTVVARGGGVVRGGRSEANGRGSPRFVNGRAGGSGRVCRYFLAGECLRADCRFSHDLERALCRFWLRGTCAKGEACEFLHHLPENVDVSGLTGAMASAHISGRDSEPMTPPVDEFPVLGSNTTSGGGSSTPDLSRTRFAAAVKKGAALTPKIPQPTDPVTMAARRQAMGSSAISFDTHTAIIAPRMSPRIKLRPSMLLPTLPTGGAMNAMYMSYRQRALQLGAARNACLSRAADAWRRGDGAAAKRFSREGADLNAKMRGEMADSAKKLMRERNKVVEAAVRSRDASWSDDPADRSTRGRPAGSGMGVLLGVASRSLENGRLTPEERTECVVDLHGLHANEATDILEEFLVTLEREHFYGLAYVVVGEEKHTGTQDPGRGASRHRLATSVREFLHHWGYPWIDRGEGVICVDPLTNSVMATRA